MGEQRVSEECDHERLRIFTRALLIDMWALEQMLVSGLIESGVRRIGAEQEMFLVDRNMRPAPLYGQVLRHLNDSRFVTELAKFNLEANVTPLKFGGRSLRVMEAELQEMMALARRAAAACNAEVVLTGILPTLTLQDLTLDNITDLPRYRELNRTLTALRGQEFVVHIKGLDQLDVTSDNMMLEACNTSFQVHYQVDPERFHEFYNVAQAITAPLLAVSVNSPLLFRKRLWHETRLALFEHSVDERSITQRERERPPRVGFGDSWMRGSVMDLYREDIARFRIIMTSESDEDPNAVLMRGEIPRLSALRIHNGTVWHWNRPCYGILDGKPHLRIENRVMPAGPTIIDEMANAALFFGLMHEMAHEYPPIPEILQFDHAKENFYAAARHGLNAQFHWMRGRPIPSSELLRKELIPLARQGLKRADIDPADIERYLGVLEERVQSGITGSQWILKSITGMNSQQAPQETRFRLLTEALLRNQRSGIPVHCWEPATLEEPASRTDNFRRVGQFMSTDLFTVRPDDLVDLAAGIMDWEHVRHVPVEDDAGKLVGLLSHRDLLHLFVSGHRAAGEPIPVRDIMKRDPVTVTPETPTLEAIGSMRQHRIGCLPVVRNDRLVGIVTLFDLLNLSSGLLEQALKEESIVNKEACNDCNSHRQTDNDVEHPDRCVQERREGVS